MDLDDLLRQADDALPETAALLADLVRIPSINAGPNGPGDETAVCLALKAKLAADGLASDILAAEPERGNLLAGIGEGAQTRLLFMGHTDVVPVDDGPEWRHPPFSGAIADGAVHGRGTADCKGLVAAEAMAMLLLHRSGLPLTGRLTLAAGADEETGGRVGFGWLVANYPDRLRADFALNEGGGSAFYLDGRPGYVLTSGEKGRLEAAVRLLGKGGHAAVPWAAHNAVQLLGEAVRRLSQYRPVPDFSHPLFEAARALLGTDVTRLLQVPYDNVSPGDRGLLSSLLGASRMTITPTMTAAGTKSNAIPVAANLTCDVRTLPGQTTVDVEREMSALLAGLEGASVSLTETAEPSSSPYPSEFSEALQRATAAAVGRQDLAWLPGLTVGFTDSRFLRRLGTVTYGFTPEALTPDATPEGVHGRGERLPLESLRVLLRTLVATAWELLVAH
jgi:acetylornithine deacetylase/succinyl-diaminopimelate desuccinylase-like protein